MTYGKQCPRTAEATQVINAPNLAIWKMFENRLTLNLTLKSFKKTKKPPFRVAFRLCGGLRFFNLDGLF